MIHSWILFQLVFLLMAYFSSQRKVHGNFALRHMIVFSNFEIKEMFWWNNFFFFLLFFVIKCITLLGKSTVLLPPLILKIVCFISTAHSIFSTDNFQTGWKRGGNLMQSTGKPPKNSIKMQRNSLKPYKSNLFINVSLLLLCT